MKKLITISFYLNLGLFILWILANIYKNIFSLEFANEFKESRFYTIGIFLCLGSLLVTFIKIFSQENKIAIKIRNFLLVTLAYGIITYISIASNYGLCSYENEEILFTNRNNTSIKIVKREFSCGAVDSEQPQIKIHQIVENAYFFAKATLIDTAKIEKKDWINVRVKKTIDKKFPPIEKDSILSAETVIP